MKFLHIADIHLGCSRYQLEESPKDFFLAWYDVLEKKAVAEQVDFVLIAGDFFHKKNIEPQAMNHAFAGLRLLKENNIPVFAIEGNHDQSGTDNPYSWLRSLAAWGLVYLLEPKIVDGKAIYEKWEDAGLEGGFADIGGARIFGSKWYGASANAAIPMLTRGIKENLREGAFHILMLHTDVEGHQSHPLPALSLANLKELRSVTDYVALGHTHKKFEIENWCFNPGSLEPTAIDEYREERGAFLVEFDEDKNVAAEHFQDYRQRPFQRLVFDVSGKTDAAQITAEALEQIKLEARGFGGSAGELEPIIEITLRGHLGFPNSLLETQKIREAAQAHTQALHVRIKNHTVPVEYAVAADVAEDAGREKLERRVIEDLIMRDNRYKEKPEAMADAVVGAKSMALRDEAPDRIADFLALKLGS
jgi:DNA repair exonuclease SbcCD nuclease subunit